MKKFDQRVVIKNTFSGDVCKWIINETEEYASRERRIDNTQIQVELMSSVLKFALISFQNTIVTEISKYYSICLCKTKYNFEIIDLLIIKYEKETDNLTKRTTYEDNSCLTIKVFLSDRKDFEGGELRFDDDISYSLSQGDAIIFSGSKTHNDINISKGSLYILVFSIDISEITSSVQD
jgi:predicted 2-oxoglutarate/Fe(II)-dependent dioxygenase YbiX